MKYINITMFTHICLIDHLYMILELWKSNEKEITGTLRFFSFHSIIQKEFRLSHQNLNEIWRKNWRKFFKNKWKIPSDFRCTTSNSSSFDNKCLESCPAYEFDNSSFFGETLVTKYSLVCKTSMIGSLRLTFNDKSP